MFTLLKLSTIERLKINVFVFIDKSAYVRETTGL